MGIAKDALLGAVDMLGQGLKGGLSSLYVDGYDEAANVCFSVIDKSIEELLDRINNGETLSVQEQYLLAQLNSLKKGLDDELIQYIKNKFRSK